jgi:hypothetical protein
MAKHTDRPNEIRIPLDLQNPDLKALAEAALNVDAAKQFARLHGLAIRKERSVRHRDVVLLVPTRKLHQTICSLRAFQIRFGAIECTDEAAYRRCVAHGLWAEYIGPDNPCNRIR